MKARALGCWVLGGLVPLSLAMAQGSLTPPGPPGETMRTLLQIEPRKPIESVPITLSQPGSYYLTGPLHHGGTGPAIEIAASDVTLDLSGFTLTGNPSSGSLISVAGSQSRVRIRSGGIGSSGQDGIQALGVSHLVLEDLHIHHSAGAGARISSGVISGLVAEDNGGPGVFMGNPVPGIGIVVKKNPKPSALARNAGGGVVIEGDFDVELSGVIHGNTGHGISWAPATPADGLRLKLEGCDSSHNTGNGLHLAGVSSSPVLCEMAGVTFSHNGGAGVFSSKPIPGIGIVVKKNPGSSSARNNGAGGIVLQGDCDIEFAGTVSGNTGHGISWSSLTPGETLRLHLDEAVIQENSGHGVRVASADPVHVDFSSTQSRIIGNQGPGVDLDGYSGTTEVTVIGSKISQNTGPGIRVKSEPAAPPALIRNSQVTDNGAEGLHLIGARAVLDGAHVGGNASHGVAVEARREFKGHVTLLKRTSTSERNGGDGVHVSSAEDDALCRVVLERSHLNGNTGSGLHLETTHAGSVAALSWLDSHAGANDAHGLVVTGAVGAGKGSVTIRGGDCDDSGAAGIVIAHPEINAGLITGVSASRNGGAGIVASSHSLAIVGNTLARNAAAGIRVEGDGHYLADNQCLHNLVGIELAGHNNALAQNVYSGGSAPYVDFSGTNPSAPIQDVTVGVNPLGNVIY